MDNSQPYRKQIRRTPDILNLIIEEIWIYQNERYPSHSDEIPFAIESAYKKIVVPRNLEATLICLRFFFMKIWCQIFFNLLVIVFSKNWT